MIVKHLLSSRTMQRIQILVNMISCWNPQRQGRFTLQTCRKDGNLLAKHLEHRKGFEVWLAFLHSFTAATRLG